MTKIDQLVQEATELLSGSDDMESIIMNLRQTTGRSEAEISEAICLIPLAFARVLFENFDINFPHTYLVKEATRTREFSFSDSSIFSIADRAAHEMALHGSRAKFLAIASQSPEFRCINQALNAGIELRELGSAVLEPPVLWHSSCASGDGGGDSR